MPEICRFYGIRITIYFDEHPPSHFHAEYGGDEAVFSVDTGTLLQGQIPKTAERLVTKWYGLQRDAIRTVWDQIQQEELFDPVPPLK